MIDSFHNREQTIEQFVFKDDDGQYYMYCGGWTYCNIIKLKDDLLGFEPFDDGEIYKEIMLEQYIEGLFVFKRKGKYYLMWSEGN